MTTKVLLIALSLGTIAHAAPTAKAQSKIEFKQWMKRTPGMTKLYRARLVRNAPLYVGVAAAPAAGGAVPIVAWDMHTPYAHALAITGVVASATMVPDFVKALVSDSRTEVVRYALDRGAVSEETARRWTHAGVVDIRELRDVAPTPQ